LVFEKKRNHFDEIVIIVYSNWNLFTPFQSQDSSRKNPSLV
jgi:hypothetical protein